MHPKPEGRGTVRLKSPDPLAAPEIRFNFLKSAYDFAALIHGMRVCREIARQPALRPFVVEEILPGPQVTSEADLKANPRARRLESAPRRGLPRGPLRWMRLSTLSSASTALTGRDGSAILIAGRMSQHP